MTRTQGTLRPLCRCPPFAEVKRTAKTWPPGGRPPALHGDHGQLAWQYAQLTITRISIASGNAGAVHGAIQAIVWRGPGQGLGQDFTDSGQSVLELLNRVGADGWSWPTGGSTKNAETGPATGIPI